jgi:hypothetical protein
VKKWLSPQEHQKLIADVESYLEQEREIAVNSPMPAPETAAGGVYCEDGCHQIKPKYGTPKRYAGTNSGAGRKKQESAIHFK